MQSLSSPWRHGILTAVLLCAAHPAAMAAEPIAPIPPGCEPAALGYPATDAAGQPVTAEQVAAAISQEYASHSRYGKARELGRDYGSVSVSAAGVKESDLMSIEFGGVQTRSVGQAVDVAYLRGTRSVKQPNVKPPTTAITTRLMVNEVPGSAGSFTLTCLGFNEDIGRGLLFIAQKPLDSREAIAADIAAVVKGLRPAIQRSERVSIEFDVPYPSNVVFTAFERGLGAPSSVSQPTVAAGSYEGSFPVALGPNARTVRIAALPTRSGTQVRANLQQAYELRATGQSTYQAGLAEDLRALLVKLANN